MAAHSGKIYATGMQMARVYLLNTLGVPNATAATVSEGSQIEAAKVFELEVPDVRRVQFLGDNVVKATMLLPRQEPTSGTLRSSRNDHDVYALLSGTKQHVVGEASVIGYATDKQGREPAVMIMCIQPGLDANGASCFRTYFVLSTRAIINPSSMNDEATEYTYALSPSQVNHHAWGTRFTLADDGYEEAEITEVDTFGMPHLAVFEGNGTATAFNFTTGAPAASVDKIHAVATVAPNGTVTDVTATVTKATTGVTFAVAPADGTVILAFYEE